MTTLLTWHKINLADYSLKIRKFYHKKYMMSILYFTGSGPGSGDEAEKNRIYFKSAQ